MPELSPSLLTSVVVVIGAQQAIWSVVRKTTYHQIRGCGRWDSHQVHLYYRGNGPHPIEENRSTARSNRIFYIIVVEPVLVGRGSSKVSKTDFPS